MHRGYTREEYLGLVAKIRSAMPDVTLSTDVIVGFPGETEADFLETLEVVNGVRFGQLYGFLYSPRPRTPAARYPGRVSGTEAGERLERLFEAQSPVQLELNQALLGRCVEILVDGPAKRGSDSWQGRGADNRVVNVQGWPGIAHGQIAEVVVTGATAHSLLGEARRAGATRGLTAARGLPEIGGVSENSEAPAAPLEVEIRGLILDPVSNTPIVILKKPDENLFLPIWIGVFEANAIALQLEGVATPRPDDPRPAARRHCGARGASRGGHGSLPRREHLPRAHPGARRRRRACARSTRGPRTRSRSLCAVSAPIRVAAAVFREAHALDFRDGEDQEARLRDWLESLTPEQLGKYKM